jgi:hypothetical protein
MSLIFRAMDEVNARALISWRYDPPYDVYNISASAIDSLWFFIDPHNAYTASAMTMEHLRHFVASALTPRYLEAIMPKKHSTLAGGCAQI